MAELRLKSYEGESAQSSPRALDYTAYVRELVSKTIPDEKSYQQEVDELMRRCQEVCSLAEHLSRRLKLAREREYREAMHFYCQLVKAGNLVSRLRDLLEELREAERRMKEDIEGIESAKTLLSQLIDVEGACGNRDLVAFLKEQADLLQAVQARLLELRNKLTPAREMAEHLLRELRELTRYYY